MEWLGYFKGEIDMLAWTIIVAVVWWVCGFIAHGFSVASSRDFYNSIKKWQVQGVPSKVDDWYKEDVRHSLILAFFFGPIALFYSLLFKDYKYGFRLW